MNKALKLAVLVCITLIISACCCKPKDGPPYPPATLESEDMKGVRGSMGRMVFTPEDWTDADTYWVDSDGVAPDVAGCHISTDANKKPTGRIFSEACLSDRVLVESNPGADVLHKHKNDVGKPDIVHCNAWCQGQEHDRGFCRAKPAVSTATVDCQQIQSAACECSDLL
jgi:hypothetical protein